jgi:hypothetical protein
MLGMADVHEALSYHRPSKLSPKRRGSAHQCNYSSDTKDGALYLPPSSHSQKMLNLFKSEEDADVSFTVRGKTYLAHNVIIKANAPILASCCNRITGEHEGSTPKTIKDIS